MSVGNVESLSLGPGVLYVAPVGSSEPSDLSTAWPAAWKLIGYTDEGSSLDFEAKYEDVEVAEEVEPVKTVLSSRSASLSFAMAEVTARNLSIAMNGGTITTAAGVTTFTPPDPSAQRELALGFESDDGQERWIFRKTKQSGKTSLKRRKGADKTTIPVEMKVLKPTGTDAWKVLLKDSRSGGSI